MRLKIAFRNFHELVMKVAPFPEAGKEEHIDQSYLTEWTGSRIKKIEFKGEGVDLHGRYVLVTYPSNSDPNKRNLTHYYIDNTERDFCLCTGADKFGKRCWHLKFRAIIMKLFKNKDPHEEDWLTRFELYGTGTMEEIKFYIEAFLDQQGEVWQGDLVDLEIKNADDQPIDRRIIGAAFLSLMNEGKIEKLYQRAAEYEKRKGGKVWVWRRPS